MEDVLFRGFHPHSKGTQKVCVNGKWHKGNWVEGYYVLHNEIAYCFKKDMEAHPDNTKHLIIKDGLADWNMPVPMEKYTVLPETVTQYINLTDCEHKMLFVGDIVCWNRKDITLTDGYFGTYQYKDILYIAKLKSGYTLLSPVDNSPNTPNANGKIGNYQLWNMHRFLRKIGNIFENPELLEKRKYGNDE